MFPIRMTPIAIWMVVFLSCLPFVSGCGGPAAATESEPEPEINYSEVLENAHRDAVDALKLFAVAGSYHRLELAQTKVAAGLEAIEELQAEEEISAERSVELGKLKADLMLLGKQAGGEQFDQQLVDYAAEIGKTDAHGEVAAYLYAQSFRLRYLENDEKDSHSEAEDAMEALRFYAESFGSDEQLRQLFAEYGRQLETERRWDKALICYEEATRLFPQDAEMATQRARLSHYYASQMNASYRAQRAYAALKAKLENRERGAFVLSSWYDKGNGGMGRFSHVVVTDIEGVSAYIKDLPQGAYWEMMRAFPNTTAGRSKAGEVRSKLSKHKLVSWDKNLRKAFNELREIAWE